MVLAEASCMALALRVSRRMTMRDHEALAETNEQGDDTVVTQLFKGYRFSVCTTPARAALALEIRRRVYRESGYDVPIPDEYDGRSWLLLAEDMRTGKPVGSLRMTPRFAGSLECEEYFHLPRRLATPYAIELTRFAILPEYRKGKTFLPIVSLGLFKLVWQIMRKTGAHHMVVASKPERIWTYEWLWFVRSGITARYAKLAGAEHELLWTDFRKIVERIAEHPFGDFFRDIAYREVVLPARMPGFGIVPDMPERPVALAVNA
jgi:hypothetical protein